ncbi:MAG: EamA family transporter [Flavobacteriales bacterium]|nr:EamA family transporter [Flavobacteriales bacterium]
MERPIFYALLSMAFAGVTAVIAKLGMQRISGDAALVVRTSLIFVLVWVNAFALRHTRELELLTRKDLLFLLLSGLTTFLSWLFYYRAVKEGNVSLVATIDKGSVVVAIALSVWLLKEPLTPKLALGAGLVLAGLLVLISR